VAAEIGAAGVAIGDLTTDEGADAVSHAAHAALGGPVEILVNNAGGGNGSDSTVRQAIDVDIPDWIATYETNTLAAVRMIRRHVPDMVRTGWGRVIQISSAVAVQPNGLGPDYSSAKAAMNSLTVSLAASLKASGVTVNTISPGLIATDNMRRWARQVAASSGWGTSDDGEIERKVALEMMSIPIGRLGAIEDVGLLVCTLASPRCGFTTGANFRVDGGQVNTIN
jgi:NAD(P)-dependent dehydrogenase (short-subunit alcohol dehydrogenase family)